MKIRLFIVGLIFFQFNGHALAAEWKEVKGDHFIVHYINDEGFAKEVGRNAETYYNRIASDLGYSRFNFWQWDNRVKIYIYPDEASYLAKTGQPAWSKGVASYTDKSISSFDWSEDFMETLLPHEIAHLIFRDFVGFKGEVPLWLDEGVAQWQEPLTRQLARRAGASVIMNKQMFQIEYLMWIKSLDGKSAQEVSAFYAQSLSIVDFLIKHFGLTAFGQFCRDLRDAKPFRDALRANFTGIESEGVLEAKWRQYVLGQTT